MKLRFVRIPASMDLGKFCCKYYLKTLDFNPVLHMSKQRTPQEVKYSSYQLEILAVFRALGNFRVYLLGIYVNINIDCAAFKKTMQEKDISPRVSCWMMPLKKIHFLYTSF